MRFSKNASLNLSINAIVILILAITMLGLGLGFMRSTFKKATGSLGDVSAEVQKEMTDRLRERTTTVATSVEGIEIKSTGEKTVYLGIKNVNNADKKFKIVIERAKCIAMNTEADAGGNACGALTVSTFEGEELTIAANSVEVFPIKLAVASGTGSDVFRLPITVNEGATVYGQIHIDVNVP